MTFSSLTSSVRLRQHYLCDAISRGLWRTLAAQAAEPPPISCGERLYADYRATPLVIAPAFVTILGV